MEIELVVFDMAGTTVHDPGMVNRCLRDALAAAGLEVPPEAANRVMGLPKREALGRLIEASPYREALRDAVDAVHADFIVRMRRFYATDPDVRAIAGAEEAFEALRGAGIAVALNSGFSRDIARIILDRLGWERRGLVRASVTSDEVPRGRPHADMIRSLMARLGVEDARAVAKVGDTPVDLEEGTNAGCGMVVGVTGGTHSRAEMERFPHTHLIETVAEFPALLGL